MDTDSDLRCESCEWAATYAALEIVRRPPDCTFDEIEVLRHHLLCSLHAERYPDYFLIIGQGYGE